MTLREILDHWKFDAKIDHSELARESLKVSQLHEKYLRFYHQSKAELRKAETQLKRLKLLKRDFYANGPTSESQAAGWVYPVRRKILTTEAKEWVEVDADVVVLAAIHAEAQDKVEACQEIVKAIRDRGFNIQHAMSHIRWKSGAG